MNKSIHLLKILADGKFHSGKAIGEQLGISRSAVSKNIEGLKQYSVDIFSVKGKGYQLAGGLDLLDEQAILSRLDKSLSAGINLALFDSIASTNSYLKQQSDSTELSVCLAEYQYQGRGRLGRQWFAPYAANIMMSYSEVMPIDLKQLSGYSLAIGVALRNCLQAYVKQPIQLKWPNDLICPLGKLAGILIETTQVKASNGFKVITGIGINVRLKQRTSPEIEQAIADLEQLGLAKSISRNQLVSSIITAIERANRLYLSEGFKAFKASWLAADFAYNKAILLTDGNKQIEAIHRGVDNQGGLLVEIDGLITSVQTGEISLRLAST
jgi:BirA family transcriptional regulator, biotin operon repressor / biotin---[acetyl-CoA-carboxylase] ligase